MVSSKNITVLFASTSGHTEYVVEVLTEYWKEKYPELHYTVKRAEQAGAEDLTAGDILILGSGTWNMYGQEGQLNDRMHALLFDRCKDVDLSKTPVALISLGDDRYYFTTRATEHFMRFLKEHGGKTLLMPLTIVNEPYGQEEKIQKWAEKFAEKVMQ